MKKIVFLVLALNLAATDAAPLEQLTTNGMNLARNASHDGRFIPFTTWAYLDNEDTNLLADLYVFDRSSRSPTLASIGPIGVAPSNSVHFGLISSNGATVVFERGNIFRRRLSDPHEQSLIPTNGSPRFISLSRDARYTFFNLNVSGFVRRDNESGVNHFISPLAGSLNSEDGRFAIGNSSTRAVLIDLDASDGTQLAIAPIAISGDAHVTASRTVGLNLVIQNIPTATSNVYPIPTTVASLNFDGSVMAYEAHGFSGRLPYAQVSWIDTSTGATNLISAAAGTTNPGNGWSGSPVISRDGRFIAFESWASDLVTDDTNDTKDIFLYDRATSSLQQINAGGGPAFNPFFSDDSATLFFHQGKTGAIVDIYALPLDNELLQITTLQFESNGSRRITWKSTTDARYQLEYKNNIDDPAWSPIEAELPSAGSETSATDPDPQSTRFYRIRAL